jgi:S-adenosylmethionine uptake transporter
VDSVAGIYLLSIGLFLFSIQDAIIKTFSDRYSILQIVFTRSVTALIIISTVMLVIAPRGAFRVHKPWPILFKGSCAFMSYICYYLAISGLPLADAATITFSAPIMVTAMSALIFREQVGWRRWCAVLFGFAAIVMVVGPKGHFNNGFVVLALAAAFTYAVSTIATRYIDSRDDAITAAFYSMAAFLFWSVVTSISVALLAPENGPDSGARAFLVRDWKDPTELDQWLLVLLGFIASAGFYCLVKAYMVAEFSAVAPFEYFYIIWGALFGFLLWGDIPALPTVAGIMLLVGSNLYILQREMAHRARTAFHRPKIPHR